ncbi:hypothetical protein, partial [Novosphingobium sp. Chol11]|uniref:hypothetical protein n=1 Tax=Novosphingobium sp. Chol11 TaxID=1385763 RepID=UPI001C3EFD86
WCSCYGSSSSAYAKNERRHFRDQLNSSETISNRNPLAINRIKRLNVSVICPEQLDDNGHYVDPGI